MNSGTTNDLLTYKDYAAHIEFDSEDRLFFGRIAGIKDIITFHGRTVDELTADFELAVDDYLMTCEKLGQMPDKPRSGKLLNMPVKNHTAVATTAKVNGENMNQPAYETFKRAAQI